MLARRVAMIVVYLFSCTVALAQKPTVEQQLEPGEISLKLSFDTAKGIPESCAVTYTNTSAARGYVELPCPLRGELTLENRAPSLALSFDQSTGDLLSKAGGGTFLLAASGDAKPPRATIAVLDPKASITVDYKTAEFCLIGHGIAPNADANVLTCFKPGKIATKVQAVVITDWNNPKKHASGPLKVKLSAADYSKHPEMRDALPQSSAE